MEQVEELKKVGLKVTTPRMRILQILETSETRHLSAEAVYKQLIAQGDEIGLATVYRVLTQFEAAGLVIRHHFEGGQSVFELDGRGHHDHLVCIQCGQVAEFTDSVIEERQLAIAKERQFKMTDHSLYIYGVCQRCQST